MITEEEQSFDEKELLDQNGEFMIFAKESEEYELETEKENESVPTENSSTQVDTSKTQTQDISTVKEVEQPTLEANFDKLNYTNKIQILLKALVIEREKNRENKIRLDIMKQQYIKRVQLVKEKMDENDELIEKVA